jgi:predicted ester cyclase
MGIRAPIRHGHIEDELAQETDVPTSKQVLDRNIAAINARDLGGFLENQQANVKFTIPGGATLQGREEVGQYMEAFWAAFPDGVLSFGKQFFAGDAAATEVRFAGTQSGPLSTPNGPIPPTGRHVSIQSVSILRIEDGRVAEEHVYMDQLDLISQLGLTPMPAAVE